MKGVELATTAVAAAALFAASVFAELDPIVIKVRNVPDLRNPVKSDKQHCAHNDTTLGLEILLQDKWHRVVSCPHNTPRLRFLC